MFNLSSSSHFLLMTALALVAWAFYVMAHELQLEEASSPRVDGEQDLPSVYSKQQALFVSAGVMTAFAALMMVPSMCSGGINSKNAGQWSGFLATAAATLVIFSWFYEAQGQTAGHTASYNVKTTSTLQAVGGSLAGASGLLALAGLLPVSFGISA